ncbi:phenoloxidase-activating factor 2-like [Colias croceus]|uniref:phenoloxidase-activating factor 2-like n=1 Tax=Colias crocea TaxID=72248 RepID=UPI001E27BD1E|nr:phenoloxidase-activating factor 2-like [Colias croceus]
MCLWLLTACLGLLPSNPSQQSQIVIIQGVPTPILQPTTAAPTTAAPTTASAAPTTTAATTTAATTRMPPPATTMMPTTAAPTSPPTMAPTTAAPTTTTTTTSRPTTGQLPIDPRLGTTTQGPSADFRLPPINGYSSQNPSDTAVRFPREKRSVYNNRIRNSAQYIYENYFANRHIISKRQSCRCVQAGTCVRNGNSYYGNGMIDIRIVTPTGTQCPTGQEYCCGNTYNSGTISCGTLQNSPTPSVTPAAGQANYGEYPWQALILSKQNDYIAGGVLIDQLNVITVTHRLSTYIVSGTAPNVKVRLGEWDAAGTYEPVPFQEYNIAKVFTHPSFDPNTLQYDITVLRLSSAVPFTPMNGAATTINRACLPPSSTSTYTGQRCWVAGWGKDMFGVQGQYQQILKEVDVPIVAPSTCQSQLQTARLGSSYVLDTTSFVCAGGEANKDACTGDGGSGLVCLVNNQWVVVGLVAWGLGCANQNVPAAYVNVAGLLPWIQQQVASA